MIIPFVEMGRRGCWWSHWLSGLDMCKLLEVGWTRKGYRGATRDLMLLRWEAAVKYAWNSFHCTRLYSTSNTAIYW